MQLSLFHASGIAGDFRTRSRGLLAQYEWKGVWERDYVDSLSDHGLFRNNVLKTVWLSLISW